MLQEVSQATLVVVLLDSTYALGDIKLGALLRPCVVTDINGSREIIVQGENGVIVPPKDADALYKAMLDIIRNKPARDRMSANARKMIASRFEQSFVRKCLMDFYDEILEPVTCKRN